MLDEAAAAIGRVNPAVGVAGAQKRMADMNTAFPDARIEGWERLVGSVVLPDPDDRHVVAAAIRGRADVIVTDEGGTSETKYEWMR